MDPNSVTREYIAKQLIGKHDKALKVVKEEFEKYSEMENKMEKSAELYKKDRDTLNERVQTLKEDRQKYYTESKELRKEFLSKLSKKKEMSDIPMEVLILTKHIDQLEWEIQTEALNIETEKRMMKQIQDNLDKLHNYANMYQEHEEVSNAVKSLTSILNKKIKLAQERHDEMLKSVDVSDEKHKNFVEAIMKLRDARSKRIGFQRDMNRHTKGKEHWTKIAEAEERNKKRGKQKAQPSNLETKKDVPKTKSQADTTTKVEKQKDTNDSSAQPKNNTPEPEPTSEPSSGSEPKSTPEPKPASDDLADQDVAPENTDKNDMAEPDKSANNDDSTEVVDHGE